MKFLIVGDLHGQMPKIHFKEFDAIIAPGDFCSDKMKPLIWQAMREREKNPECTLRWRDLAGKEKSHAMTEESLADGRKILEYLDTFGVPVYIVPGNWDWTGEDPDDLFFKRNRYPELFHGLKNVVDVHHRIVDAGGYNFIGYGISSAPEYLEGKQRFSRLKPGKLADAKKEYNHKLRLISSLFKKATKPVLFMSHNVPFDTPLDLITNKDSVAYGQHYGSVVTRRIVEQYQPVVCIGAHMHEHFGKCKIGKTVCINAGFGSKVNTFLELENGTIRQITFYPKVY